MLYFSLSLPFFDVWTPKCRMLRAKVFILKPRGRKRRQLQMKMKNYFGKRTIRLWTTSLLNSAYYFNGKIFGLRRSENRNLSLKNFELGPNFIKFEEDFCKHFTRVCVISNMFRIVLSTFVTISGRNTIIVC